MKAMTLQVLICTWAGTVNAPLVRGMEGDGDEPGGFGHVRVLHVPLVRSIEYQVAVLQQQIGAVSHAVELSLVYIGQLYCGQRFTGE